MLRHQEHVEFLLKFRNLREPEAPLEIRMMSHIKMSALYWSMTAAAILDVLDTVYPLEEDLEILQFLASCYRDNGGFAGNSGAHDAHLLFTLSAVQVLYILKQRSTAWSDPVWFDPNLTTDFVLNLQDNDGAFMGDSFGEIDSRFTYCAVAILHLLNRLKQLDEDRRLRIINSIKACRNFDGGFGAVPGAESHGGNIFCCVSVLNLLNDPIAVDAELLEWLVWRQVSSGGLNGRPEKLPDVCYSWWILSALITLSPSNTRAVYGIDCCKLTEFILAAQDEGNGGIADRPGDASDIFHTIFGLAGLAFLQFDGISAKIDPLLCLPKCTQPGSIAPNGLGRGDACGLGETVCEQEKE